MFEWEQLAEYFNKQADYPRTAESLHCKYNKLIRTKPPTGGTQMPWYVEEAKEVALLIEQRMGASAGETPDNFFPPAPGDDDLAFLFSAVLKLPPTFSRRRSDGMSKPCLKQFTSSRWCPCAWSRGG